MAHEDGYDMETNIEPNMIKNEDSSGNGHEKQDQFENKDPKKRDPRKGDPTKKDRKKETEEEKKQDSNETSPSNDSSSSYKRVLECLDILQDGYAKMDVNRICEPLAENIVWMEHPHDKTRHYVGHEAIKDFLKEEFSDVQETKVIYFPEFLIHDEKRGVVNVEWLKSKQDTNQDGNHRERHSSHSVIIKFENDQIEMIRFHSIKTNKYWTKPLVTRKLGDEKQSKKKRRNGKNGKNRRNGKNGHRNNGKNGSRGRRNGRRNNKKRNGKNGHRGGNNGRGRRTRSRNHNGHNGNNSHDNSNGNGQDYVLHNTSEQKPVAEEIENPKPISNKTSSPPSRSRGRNGRYSRDRGGRTGRQMRGRGYHNGNRNGARYQKRRGRGSGKPKKKQWVSWTCSSCNFHNAADSTSCKNCDKKFDYREDLSEAQKQQLQNTTKEQNKTDEQQQQTQQVQVPNEKESNVQASEMITDESQPDSRNQNQTAENTFNFN